MKVGIFVVYFFETCLAVATPSVNPGVVSLNPSWAHVLCDMCQNNISTGNLRLCYNWTNVENGLNTKQTNVKSHACDKFKGTWFTHVLSVRFFIDFLRYLCLYANKGIPHNDSEKLKNLYWHNLNHRLKLMIYVPCIFVICNRGDSHSCFFS